MKLNTFEKSLRILKELPKKSVNYWLKSLIIVCIITISLFNVIFIPINIKNNLLTAPRDFFTIPSGNFEGNFLVLDGSHDFKIISHNNEIIAEFSLPITYISEIEMGENNSFFLVDYEQDRIVQVSLEEPFDVIWQWDARNLTQFNWTEWCDNQTWDNESKESFKTDLTNNNLSFKFESIQYLTRSPQSPAEPSLLICSSQMNMIFEITLTAPMQIVWSYGRNLNFDELSHPKFAQLIENSSLLIWQQSSPDFKVISYPNTFTSSYFKLLFPNGFIQDVGDVEPLDEDRVIVANRGAHSLFYLNMSFPASFDPISNFSFTNPSQIEHNSTHLLVLDEISSTLYVINSVSGDIESKFGDDWRVEVFNGNLFLLELFLLAFISVTVWKPSDIKTDLLITEFITGVLLLTLYFVRKWVISGIVFLF